MYVIEFDVLFYIKLVAKLIELYVLYSIWLENILFIGRDISEVARHRFLIAEIQLFQIYLKLDS
jgi:hypothetical protein